MRCFRLPLMLVVVGLVTLTMAAARADEPGGALGVTTKAEKADSPATGVVEIKPDVLYVRDKENHLIPLVNWSYAEIVKYYRLMQQLDQPEQKPRYNLQQLTIDGTASADRADLTLTLKLLTTEAGWSKVPLRLGKCALRESVTYQGSGEQFLLYEPSGDGYVLWIKGAAGAEHKLTLKLVAPLTVTAGESRLDLQPPHAAASQLTLHVPKGKVAATVSAGAAAPEIVSDAGGSRLTTLGLGSDFWLAWRDVDHPAAQLSTALEANGQLLVKIDGRSANTDATLTVRSFGAEFDHLQIRLPPGAQLVESAQAPMGYTLAPNSADRSLVDVKLDRKTTGPIDLHLTTERAYDVTKSSETLDLAGFVVTEAIAHRQWGQIAVAVSGDWQLNWGERNRVRQIDDLPEALKRRDVVAGFEYFGQPSSLQVRVQPRKTRVSVDPQYTYRVRPDRAELEGKLKYTIRGARLFKLDLDLAGWELDRVTPDSVVDLDAVVQDAGSIVSLPLTQPASGDLELTFQAHRALSGDKQVDWQLPTPVVDVLSPADVTIVAAPNVELTPSADRSIGLTRVAGGFRPDLREPGVSVLSYRAEQSKAHFVADFTPKARAVSVDIDNRVALRLRELEINQTFNYLVRYEAIDHLAFDVPRGAFDERRLKFYVAGEPAEAVEAAEQPSASRRSVQIPLPRPALGPLRVEARLVLNRELAPGATSATVDVPLAMPQEGQVTTNALLVTADPAIRVEQREGPWSVVTAGKSDSVAPAGLRLTATGGADLVRLAESLDPRRIQGATFVNRAWVQCWITDGARQDRAVYALTSTESQLRLQLPAGVAPSDVELTLDGKPMTPLAAPSGSLAVALGADTARQEHLLEVRYQLDGGAPRSGWLSLETPKFESHVKVRRQYVQLVLPKDEILVTSGSQSTPEYQWRWRDYGLGIERQPLKEQRQLEQWVGYDRLAAADGAVSASGRDDSEAPLQTNRYLFTTIGADSRVEVLVARQWLLLLVASAGVLALGLGVMYLQVLRRPAVVIAALATAFWAALSWSDPVILLAQAAAVGAALIPLAIWLRWLLAPEIRPPVTVSPSGLHSNVDRSSKRVSFGSGRQSSPTTTAPTPVVVGGQASNP